MCVDIIIYHRSTAQSVPAKYNAANTQLQMKMFSFGENKNSSIVNKKNVVSKKKVALKVSFVKTLSRHTIEVVETRFCVDWNQNQLKLMIKFQTNPFKMKGIM